MLLKPRLGGPRLRGPPLPESNNKQFRIHQTAQKPCTTVQQNYIQIIKHTTFQFFIMTKFIMYCTSNIESNLFFNLCSNIYIQKFYVFAYVFVYELIIYKYKSDRWKRHNYEVRSIHLVLMKIHSLFIFASQLRDTHAVICYSLTRLDGQ